MDIKSVCLVGGTGFVGRAVAELASPRGMRVRVLTRYDQHAAAVKVLPTVEVMVGSPYSDADLDAALDDMDAVVNCVGILHEGGRGRSFRDAHVELPRRIAQACGKRGVQHLLHVSALGASPDGPSDYQRSKAAGEEALRQAAGALPWTIFRPSIIFGEGDRFLNMFADLARVFPVIPLGRANARMQPVWVDDVARAIVGSFGEIRTFGQTYELCGPRAYTLEELVRYAGGAVGRKPRIMALPDSLANLQAAVFEHLPGKVLTRDNLRSLGVDNVCGCPFPEVFGFEPSALEAVAPDYLAGQTPRGRYARFRYFAGRQRWQR
ncbi:MAG TPA: complex I NDUFA9 subunit family protein [Usitatibacter sp.]|nr:complex I NDUFA9 subunit family protein [Usitatibacter sp.]